MQVHVSLTSKKKIERRERLLNSFSKLKLKCNFSSIDFMISRLVQGPSCVFMLVNIVHLKMADM